MANYQPHKQLLCLWPVGHRINSKPAFVTVWDTEMLLFQHKMSEIKSHEVFSLLFISQYLNTERDKLVHLLHLALLPAMVCGNMDGSGAVVKGN